MAIKRQRTSNDSGIDLDVELADDSRQLAYVTAAGEHSVERDLREQEQRAEAASRVRDWERREMRHARAQAGQRARQARYARCRDQILEIARHEYPSWRAQNDDVSPSRVPKAFARHLRRKLKSRMESKPPVTETIARYLRESGPRAKKSPR